MPTPRHLVPKALVLVSLASLSGCTALGASLVGGGGGYNTEAVEALKKDCDMKSGELAVGKYVRVECFDPERWR